MQWVEANVVPWLLAIQVFALVSAKLSFSLLIGQVLCARQEAGTSPETN